MASGSSSRTPLLPGFAPGSDGTAMGRDGAALRTGENHHALQDDRTRTHPGSPGVARAAPREPDAAFDRGADGRRPEIPSRLLDEGDWTGEAGERPELDFKRVLELALQELQDNLPSDSSASDAEALSLDAAMAHLLSHTPTA